MDSACRICMAQQTDNTELFQPLSKYIIDKVEFCTGVLIKNKQGLPFHLCNKCMVDIQIAHDLKTRCIDSNRSFEILWKVNKDVAASNADLITLNCEGSDDVKKATESVKSTKKGSKVQKNRKRLKKEMPVPQRETVIQSAKNSKTVTPTESSGLFDLPAKGVNESQGAKFKMLFCELCQMKFANKKESLEHKKKLHKNDQMWICEVCGKLYAHRSSQIAHMRSHFPERYKCNDCDYTTYNKYDLIKHLKIHIGDKPFKCAQCGAAYHTSSNLRVHVRSRHEQRASFPSARRLDTHCRVKRHTCDICSARFTKRVYMKNHLLKQHGIAMPKIRPGRRRTELILNRSDDIVK